MITAFSVEYGLPDLVPQSLEVSMLTRSCSENLDDGLHDYKYLKLMRSKSVESGISIDQEYGAVISHGLARHGSRSFPRYRLLTT